MERKLPESAVTLLHVFDDSGFHTFKELMDTHVDTASKTEDLIRKLHSEGYISGPKGILDFSHARYSAYDVFSITPAGVSQLALEDEEIIRRSQDVLIAEEANSTAKKAIKRSNISLVIAGAALLIEVLRLLSEIQWQ